VRKIVNQSYLCGRTKLIMRPKLKDVNRLRGDEKMDNPRSGVRTSRYLFSDSSAQKFQEILRSVTVRRTSASWQGE
jgi:hypothetical protein